MALVVGGCRQRSLPRVVSRRSVGLPELTGGQRPAVAACAACAACAAGRQRGEVARRGVEPLLALLGLARVRGRVRDRDRGRVRVRDRVRVGARVGVRVRARASRPG